MNHSIYIGTAAWNIPSAYAEFFPEDGSHLERYSEIFNCVEINSSFYKDHQAKTYEKWAKMVPGDFRFAVKLSRYFTQDKRLKETGKKLSEVLNGILYLKEKFGVLLVQLPPSLEYDHLDTRNFLLALRTLYGGFIAWEPRHISWKESADLLTEFNVTKVFADPEPCPFLLSPQTFQYCRLHGTPEIYKSNYEKDFLAKIACGLTPNSWCIFDNTTFGHATQNALDLQKIVRQNLF